MLKIISIPQNGLPNSYPVYERSYFQPGQLAMFYLANGQKVCGLSNGQNAVGILDDVFSSNDDSTQGSKRVTVWNAPGLIAETDQTTDIGLIQNCVQNLFVNDKGCLSLKRLNDQKPLARLIAFKQGILAFKWL